VADDDLIFTVPRAHLRKVSAQRMVDEVTVYISIGNSDDRLSRKEWADFLKVANSTITSEANQRHGRWFSSPHSEYLNACWCVQVHVIRVPRLKARLAKLAGKFKQDAIAWAEAPTTELLGPAWEH